MHQCEPTKHMYTLTNPSVIVMTDILCKMMHPSVTIYVLTWNFVIFVFVHQVIAKWFTPESLLWLIILIKWPTCESLFQCQWPTFDWPSARESGCQGVSHTIDKLTRNAYAICWPGYTLHSLQYSKGSIIDAGSVIDTAGLQILIATVLPFQLYYSQPNLS